MISVSTIGFMVYYGMGAALAVRVSHFMGQKDFPNLRRAVNSGMGIILSLAIVASLFFYLVRTPIIYSFTEDHEVMIVVSSLIFSLIVYQFGDALQITFCQCFARNDRCQAHDVDCLFLVFYSCFTCGLFVWVYMGRRCRRRVGRISCGAVYGRISILATISLSVATVNEK